MSSPLTPRQQEILDTFRRLTAEDDGVPPTVRVLAAAVGLRSYSTANHQLRTLAGKGYLIHKPNKALAFRLPREATGV